MWKRKKNLKSTQEEQDEAFFGVHERRGSNNHIPGRNNSRNSNISNISNSNISSSNNDEKLAMELQEQYMRDDLSTRNSREKARQEQEDRDMAIMLQRMGSSGLVAARGGGPPSSAAGATASPAPTTPQQQQQQQWEQQRRNQRQRGRDEERKRQEDEDAKLARAIQDEEQRGAVNQHGRSLPRHAGNHNANGNRLSGIRDHHTINALVPRCAACNQIVVSPIVALGNLYHRECFKCAACHELIESNESFAVMTDDDGQRFPMHKKCYSDLYGLKCTVCHCVIEGDSNGRVSYIKHPFFQEVMCPSHTNQRKCTGCHRVEPLGAGNRFADLGDANRCVCYSCCRTVIVDSNDAKPLWNKVIGFFSEKLHLPIFDSMESIPVLIVPHEALNSQLQQSHYQGSPQMFTRGLCLTEHQIGWNLMLPSLTFDRSSGSFLPSDAQSRGHTYFEIPKASKANPQTSVTAILCLSGLPADLTASILAHEATHAWIKLHPSFNPSMPIPLQVEEGVCQLVAMLFLTDGLEEASKVNEGDGGPSDEKLRQYFKFSIETDTSEVYGEGYRKAAKAYAHIGIEALLSHIVTYREFPNI